MKVKVAKTNNLLFRAYNCYRNYTPIHVLTTNETIIFNTIVFSLVAALLYWTVYVVPALLINIGERMYYYLTGQTISISLVCSFAVRHILNTSKPPGLRSNLSQMSDYYRKK